jgi:hypothetical protein
MSDGFNTRATHALLVAVIVLLCDLKPSFFGPIGDVLHPIVLISLCFFWAYLKPKLRDWVDRRAKRPEETVT